MIPQILEAEKTQFSLGQTNFYAINSDKAKLIYSATLEESRQIFAVTRTLDFSELSMANDNLMLSLKRSQSRTICRILINTGSI